MSRRSGLGRGLAALIPPSTPIETGADTGTGADTDPGAEIRDGLTGESVAEDGDSDATSGGDRDPAARDGRSADERSTTPEPLQDDEQFRADAHRPPAEGPLEEATPRETGMDSEETESTENDLPPLDTPETSPRAHRPDRADDPDAPADGSGPSSVRGPETPPASAAAAPSSVGPLRAVPTPSVSAAATDGRTEPGPEWHPRASDPPPTEATNGVAARVPAAAATLAEVAPTSIVPNPRQPREVFDPEELAGLATSLADVGILQPLVVRPLTEGRYELVAGERRLRAAELAGLDTVPVVIRHTEDANLLKEALVENIHRVQLNPLEEGAAYQQLLEEFGVTQEELATRLGRSRPAISNAIRLLQLPSGVQRRVASGVLSAGHAKVLLGLEDPDQQVRLADRIVAEGMSVRATEELVRLRALDGGSGSAPSRRRPVTAPGLVELQDDLSDALEARVKISMGAKRGKLAIEFASVDDLERIVSVIANGLEGERAMPAVAPEPGPTTV